MGSGVEKLVWLFLVTTTHCARPLVRKGQTREELICTDGTCFTKIYEVLAKGVSDKDQLSEIEEKAREAAEKAMSAYDNWVGKGARGVERPTELVVQLEVPDLPGVGAAVDRVCDNAGVCRDGVASDIENGTLTILFSEGKDGKPRFRTIKGDVREQKIRESKKLRGKVDVSNMKKNAKFFERMRDLENNGNYFEWIGEPIRNIKNRIKLLMTHNSVRDEDRQDRLALKEWLNRR
jgi:hypothetical protein